MLEKTWPLAENVIRTILELTENLYQQLDQEAGLLKSAPKPDLVDSVTATKRQILSELETCNQQLGQILTVAKLPNTQDGIQAYFQQAENIGISTSATLDNWAAIRSLCSDCKSLNEQNGASIELLATHAKRALDILKGKTREAGTYGRNGVTENERLSHTLTLRL